MLDGYENIKIDRELSPDGLIKQLETQLDLNRIAAAWKLADPDYSDWKPPIPFPPTPEPKTPRELLEEIRKRFIGWNVRTASLQELIEQAQQKAKSATLTATAKAQAIFYVKILITACKDDLIPISLRDALITAINQQDFASINRLLIIIFVNLGLDVNVAKTAAAFITSGFDGLRVGDNLCEVLEEVLNRTR